MTIINNIYEHCLCILWSFQHSWMNNLRLFSSNRILLLRKNYNYYMISLKQSFSLRAGMENFGE